MADADRAAADALAAARRPSSPTTTASSASAPTSSRARCSPPTAAACSRCRSGAAASPGSPPTRGPSSRSTGCASAARCAAACARFEVRRDTRFGEVMVRCADPRRPGGWITPKFVKAYVRLHRLGWAHSVECYDDAGELVGGLYGVRIGGFFAGESMFHTATDASKVALVALVDWLRDDRRDAARRAVDDAATCASLGRRRDPSRTSTSTGSRGGRTAGPHAAAADEHTAGMRPGGHALTASDDRTRRAVVDADVLRALDGRGVQRAVPDEPRQGPDRAVDRLRPADADRLRPRLPDGPRRGRQGRRAGRPPRPHAHAARRHPAGRR